MKHATLQALLQAQADKRPAVLVTDLASGDETLIVDGQASDTALQAEIDAAVRADCSRTVDHDGRRLFINVFNPPLRLIVVGAVHIAQALVPMASIAGYDVTVVDPRRAFASDERFPDVRVNRDWPDEALEALAPDARTAVVTLTHDPKLDDPALDMALRSPAFYIASLGSKKTHAARLDRLASLGHDQATLARIHGPAGLPLGAVSPAEIAIAVIAQMTRALRQDPAA